MVEKISNEWLTLTNPIFLSIMAMAIIIPSTLITLHSYIPSKFIIFEILAIIIFPSGCIFFPIGMAVRYKFWMLRKYCEFKTKKYNKNRAETAPCAFCKNVSRQYSYMIVAYREKNRNEIVSYQVLPICEPCQNDPKYIDIYEGK